MARESLFLDTPEATDALGRSLAQRLRPGALVLLSGELGAGKSALARALIRALMDDPGLEVPSPSFSLVQPYRGENRAILHADLYRLGHEAEMDELGLFDDPDAIRLVEWPERAPSLLDLADLAIRLDIPPGGAGRTATLDWAD
ncbi:tRNA (adenosine(37)-N6)-threonylcarbamoyltransferase complex ATPase subunit type 1 TsaE [Arsenicitalea aurantiaca]|uniref:tRNA threonylcarbamoyladenosine biosynthesis protein TsaE n=1 Tax=Arsenicitalea aurantiaca TaxID=1783274 RepID=A0A433X8E9_9HYPH|nr:tRNA (adenosine(37)-N6)-threonylcarbamoyltransferase complex ATPase subunit type 1 TsaE [Arsenicitalea aurantiaca]RUT30318.1 tRNA (adenosine(37)-N6)-threonylcarbamoyltransferase complex ATPase subunit type 1 TsaE [Arsenicitalea aurantiaca]